MTNILYTARISNVESIVHIKRNRILWLYKQGWNKKLSFTAQQVHLLSNALLNLLHDLCLDDDSSFHHPLCYFLVLNACLNKKILLKVQLFGRQSALEDENSEEQV